MAIELTTPVPIPDTTFQGITKIDFHFPHFKDTGEVMKLNKPDIVAVFTVTTWTGDGTVLSEARHKADFPDWPANFTIDVQSVYSRIEQYAESQGFIGAGTPESI